MKTLFHTDQFSRYEIAPDTRHPGNVAVYGRPVENESFRVRLFYTPFEDQAREWVLMANSESFEFYGES